MRSCPVKGSPEWDRLVKQVGIDKALIMFNKDEIPSMFTEGLVTNDKSVVYTVDESINKEIPVGNSYARTSSVMDRFMQLKPKRDGKLVAEQVFARAGVDKVTGKITRGYILSNGREERKEFTFDEYVAHIDQIQEARRLYGKFIHKLIETNGVLSKEKAMQDYNLPEEKYNEGTELYNNLKEGGKFKYLDGDVVHREKVVSIDGKLVITNNEEVDIEVDGIAGTIDELVEHEDGTISIRDFKTGALSNSVIGNFLSEYADKKVPISVLNKAKLQIILYAVMLKINNPDLKFKKLEVLKIQEAGSDADVYNNAMEDLRIFLPIIKKFFQKNVKSSTPIDESVWDEVSYISKNKSLQTRLEKLKDESNPFKAARTEILREIEKQNKEKHKAKDKEDVLRIEELITKLLYQLDELEHGYSTISTGEYKQGMDLLSAFINDKDRVSNPLVQTFTNLFNEAVVLMNQEKVELNREFKQYLKPVTSNNPNYKEAFDWFWNEGNITTYLSQKWNTLTKEQQEYADFYRWNIRFQLFKTMNPLKGIEIIKQELENRESWTLDKSILVRQIEELESLCWIEGHRKKSINKLNYFQYYEGWTPRVTKTSEESKWNEYLSTSFKSLELTEAEKKEIELARADNTVTDRGITLMFMPENGKEGQEKGIYTFNPNLIFSLFTDNAIKKSYMDDVVNVGNAITSFLGKKDEAGNRKFFSGSIAYVNNILTAAVKGLDKTQLGTFEVPVKVKDSVTGEYKETGETTTYSYDKILRAGKSMVGFTAMAFQPLASFRRGISGTLTYAINSVGNDLAKFMGVKNTEFGMADGFSAWVDSWGLQATMKKDEKKVYLMSSMFGNLPDGYDGVGRQRDGFIQRADPYMYRKLKEFGFVIDRVVDNANFNATMVGQLKAMKIEMPDGSIKSMYDAYQVVNGKLVYTGKPRGVDAITGELITGLTPIEINRLKALSKRMYGAYRDEERIGLEVGVLGAIYMQFKKFAMPIYYAALGQSFDNKSLGNYEETGEIDKAGNKILVWKGRPEEGFIISVIKYLVDVYRVKGNFFKAWNNMNDGQKRGIVLATTKLGFFFVLGKLIAYGFGDDDDDDKNKIKQLVNQVKRETATEFDVYATISTISAVPTFNKAKELIDGVYSLTVDSVVGGERIESGIFKEGYFGGTLPPLKGIPQIMKNIPIASSVWSAYRQTIDWQEINQDIATR
jgi:molecular chaperone GrpE (heat shock protein)